jgi:hypothetical protein
MKINFVGGAYAGRSSNVNAERCLNFYFEAGPDPSLVGTPGLTRRLTLSYGPVRGLHEFGGFLYAVAGPKLYKITSDHVVTLIGEIGTSFGPVSIADNGTYMVMVDGSASGYYTDGASLSTISDTDFTGANTVTYQDGYFIVSELSSGRFRISELNSVTSWVDTDYATAEGWPDDTRAVISVARELWILGSKTSEVWWNSGNSDFPFERIQAGFIPRGIISSNSVSQLDNSLAWVSSDERGHPMAVQVVNGYQAQVISTTNINWQWSQYARWDDCFTYTYQLEGHEFWVVTFPTANRTWVYDATTKQWHQWSSNLSGEPLSRHRSNCHAYCFGRHYVGDYNSGKIYTLESEVYTEDGSAIIRDRISQHANSAEERISISQLQVCFEEGVGLISGQGSNPSAMLRWSKDGGHTWSNELTRSVGAIGEFGTRAVWRKLGVARNWTFWLRVSDPVKWIVTDAVARPRHQDKKEAA